MTPPMPSQITSLLSGVMDPYLGQDLVQAKIIQEITIESQRIGIRLVYPYPILSRVTQLKQSISELLKKSWPTYSVMVAIESRIRRHKVQEGLKPKSAIKNIIAVGSGKGGVGKSTVAINLALALKAIGAKVALLDADIYGPSQPRMLGRHEEHAYTHQKKLLPVENFGIQSISMGYLVDEATPMVWRGPMVSGALQQLLNDTAWDDCDYLIIDLPPGTGDIQLTLAQKIPLSGAVIVTTPQDIALLDVRRAYHMFQKVGVPVLGVVENMSWHECTQCHHREHLFGQGGGEKIANEFNTPLLGQIPLDARIGQLCEAGRPIVVEEPQGTISQIYLNIAEQTAAKLALREVEHAATLSQVVLEG